MRLSLITGGLSGPYCPLATGPHGAVSHGHSSLKLAVFTVWRPGAVFPLAITARCQSQTTAGDGDEDLTWGLKNQTCIQKMSGHCPLPLLPQWTVPSIFQASAFPESELPPTIGLLWWLQVSHPQTQIQTIRQLRKGETDTVNKQDGGRTSLKSICKDP